MTRTPPFRLFTRLVASTVFAACAMTAQAFDLTVELQGAQAASGTVMGAVYGVEAAWLKTGQALQLASVPAAQKTVLVYRGLPAGRYAASFFLDQNGNGKLDTNVVGLPTEPYGFSRDARGRMGPPSFADAAFDMQQDMTISVKLN